MMNIIMWTFWSNVIRCEHEQWIKSIHQNQRRMPDFIRNKLIMDSVKETYKKIDAVLRKASIAQIGGFRPPENKITSWFGGRGAGLADEVLPQYKGKDMFCLLQVKVSELPYVPPEIDGTEFLVIFFNREEIPFNKPNGEGWLIREYNSLEGLQLLPESGEHQMVKDFPIKWSLVEDDAPGWENAWDLMDLTSINETRGASDIFYERYHRYSQTKFGGFPYEIQHGAELEGFVFQIGSEEKPGWMWSDNGIAYFNKDASGEWIFDCQFY